MQTIMNSGQESEQSRPVMGVGEHVGNLFFGLLLGFLLLIFDRPHSADQGEKPQPVRSGRWGRTLLIYCGAALALLLLVILVMGP